jgi:hypothetical protein
MLPAGPEGRACARILHQCAERSPLYPPERQADVVKGGLSSRLAAGCSVQRAASSAVHRSVALLCRPHTPPTRVCHTLHPSIHPPTDCDLRRPPAQEDVGDTTTATARTEAEAEANAEEVWAAKQPTLLWRGSPNGGAMTAADWRFYPRPRVVELSRTYPELVRRRQQRIPGGRLSLSSTALPRGSALCNDSMSNGDVESAGEQSNGDPTAIQRLSNGGFSFHVTRWMLASRSGT